MRVRENLKNLSVVAKTAVITVFVSIFLLFIASMLFIKTQDTLIEDVTTHHKEDSLALVKNRKNENLRKLREDTLFYTKVIADISSLILYNLDSRSLKKSIKPFLHLEGVVGIEVFDNLSKLPFVSIFQEGYRFKKGNTPSFDAPIKYEDEFIGKVILYYTKEQILKDIAAQQERIEEGIRHFHSDINDSLHNSIVFQIIIFLAIGSILTLAVLKAFSELEKRILSNTRELESKNSELAHALKQLKEAQQQLIESEKMAALGGLVAGIAHEINTPLGVGVTASSHLREKAKGISRLYEEQRMKRSDLEGFLQTTEQSSSIILSNLERSAELVQSFKKVAVDQSSEELRRFNIREYIEEIIISLRPKIKRSNIKIEIVCDKKLVLNTYPGLFSGILTNLIVNTLIHAYDKDEEGRITITLTQDATQTRMEYRDYGRGIAKAHIKKIFEPFFTTRRGQGGSGLGMHIIYNIVTQKMGGSISCSSTQGEGALFIIIIPNQPKSTQEQRNG